MKPADLSWGKYLQYGLGRRLSLVGERLDAQLLIYNPLVMLKFHEESKANAPKLATVILRNFADAKTFFDVGCGSGAFAAELMRRGIDVVGCERSRVGRKLAERQGIDCRPFDLDHTPAANVESIFDIVTCFEVGEHLPARLAAKLVRFICEHGTRVIFTAAHPGQGGTGHVNEQPKDYWISLFATSGFALDPIQSNALSAEFSAAGTSPWFADNVLAFLKQT
jgi:SAM-dependent methyltransferase